MPTPRVLATPAAEATIDLLREQHGPLMFHQSGGCCDGSSPMCFAKGEFRVGSSDVWLGQIHGCDFFMSAAQFEYWQHTQLMVDVTKGRGASFSLEIPLGVRFLIRSRLFTEEESRSMAPVYDGEEYVGRSAEA
ncbi:DUF779 domain-containing protein [Hymenobacter glacieicola]|uniref:UDP-glucose 4-epimerase n=1 Tax=Hymenobacter glacieicola TaxID=1562124 RepID=A0ABQ1WZK4_9BACT|nr:DUF779 domain-containing protein [Hymenobacter glacieicola]GGG52523.1 hypothetical protein GCM10011378_30930 [Hymenobacter glacieicola]